MNFYASIFKNSEVKEVRRWGKGGPTPEGSVMGGTVVLEGLMVDKDPSRAGRAMQAMMKLKEIDIQALRDAADSL